ncbi:Cysteine-rich protein 1 [Chelonia mydas]|uniref:Cysteine-rich protein 1 n=1 Tax=Chelonia mydas TaxID=8469 RepID=M7BBL1_CHEMY|nr:Cysteine-rich protein 1 [Chelonia mydas]
MVLFCFRSLTAEKVTSLGKDWHRPCLKCEKCNKTLTSGGHAEHDGKPYCNQPCYSALFGPKGKFPCLGLPAGRGGILGTGTDGVCLQGFLPRSMITCSSTQIHAHTPPVSIHSHSCLNSQLTSPPCTPHSHSPLAPCLPPYVPKLVGKPLEPCAHP